jgi:hypothetical protein
MQISLLELLLHANGIPQAAIIGEGLAVSAA